MLNRRSFLKTGAAGLSGLVIGFSLPAVEEAIAATEKNPSGPPVLNAWIHVGTDNVVTVIIDKAEMGQGVMTSLAMLAAEQLDCDWSTVRTRFAPADRAAYGLQSTGGSSSIRRSYDRIQKAGAAARWMLVSAAAKHWRVEPASCRTDRGAVVHSPTNRRLSYGSLAKSASKLPVPKDPPLKAPGEFRIIGKPLKRLDTPDKVTGRAQFGIDVRVPGMLHANVARCPVFGGRVGTFDASKARAVPGVKDVVSLSDRIAVVADNTWAAMEGRRALAITWDEGANANLSSQEIRQLFIARTQQPGAVDRNDGDAPSALASAARLVQAVYEAPYLAHATMEPMNCTAHVQPQSCEVWVPTQAQTRSQEVAAQAAGLPLEATTIHSTYLGGGFGRRVEADFVAEAVEISKAIGAPVKVTWTREDDIQHDYYRPASYVKFSAGLDPDGWPIALDAHIACPSIFTGIPGRVIPNSARNGIDPTSTEGCSNIPYDIPNFRAEYHKAETAIPVGFWRSVGHSQNGFFSESFIDELAAATKKDPYEFRRRLLKKAPRHLGALDLAAERSAWGTPPLPGRFRGIAVLYCYGSYVAEVAEISVDRSKGSVTVHRVVCAVDCGRVVNPDIIKAQMASAIVYGLTAALKGKITIDRGRVQQSNFHNYQILRMSEMPAIEVYQVESSEAPGGVGEPGAPVIAPAVCNAIFAATGRRIRQLPIRPDDLL